MPRDPFSEFRACACLNPKMQKESHQPLNANTNAANILMLS
jgi:hypothetical protein